MPYKDPEKQRLHVKSARARFYRPPVTKKPRLYYVTQVPTGLTISSMYGGTSTIAGPLTFLAAVDAYVNAGGVAADLGIE